MKWLEKLFKSTPKGQEMSSGRKEKYSKLPIDEAFVMNFKEKGGIFLYIDSIEELEEVFQKILLENNANATIFTHNEDLEELFYSQYPSYFTGDSQQATLFLTDCEYLVADEGSVLFSSRQLGQKRLDELPPSLIIIAKTSQVTFLATTTPVLAYAGLSLGKDLGAFRRLSWRIIPVALAVTAGTFICATALAQLVLHLEGLI